ncbi:type VI secretion system protein TssA [Variovorax sp. NFACC27]|uniref:type VI secretion system protein TssA n=1 Tax=unclassified Variovorax TaxID=663243 RepID=UPI00089B9441|nr:type VI secretion system protein ImpA [Variovorax sp. NFACC28]SEG53956.1 type VI secretion system protein ImpA [Variovorax sp. NFACC29]SFC15027.1 type VI secretion system protein ImpA [Variovorax sp. NFACC26]SFH10267.1 type VI secretion system protein ImpA [Variovorax sp. NFACC27]
MLNNELAATLLAPIGDASPCGDDLEYDADFMALVADAQGKPEQQFGDTVIPAVEPEWREVGEKAEGILRRSKDVRAAVLLLRASTRMQGVEGFAAGLRLLNGLLDTFWDGIHPKLDADDDNDPTMRLNALAPLTDEAMGLRDLYEAQVGVARGVGPIRVRDIAIAHNTLTAVGGEATYSMAQVQGGLETIQSERPDAIQAALGVLALVDQLRKLIADRTGRADAFDFDPLRSIARVLQKACASASGASAEASADEASGAADTQPDGAAAARPAAARGEIQSRQDAVQMLDRVIRYLEQAEPGNPAPLLIERAKKLIGVSFLEIMANLAPNAMDTIETVTGRRPSE